MANPAFGVFLHAVGGLAAGSFYVPFRRVKEWSWESAWLVQGVAAWLVMPWVAAWLTVPDPAGILAASPPRSLALAYGFGALWGIGGLTFGLSMRYLGLSLGYAVALGFCAAFGTLVPPVVHGTFGELTGTAGGATVLAGVGLCLAGIALGGRAGIRKERELTDDQKRASVREFSLLKGFAVAVFAGVMSACMAFAVEAGAPIAEAAVRAGAPTIYQNNPVFVVIMAGGFTTNFLWCAFLLARNRTAGDYVRGPAGPRAANFALALLAGAIWYGQFFFYGMGTTRMGRYDFSSWSIHMAFIIVFSGLWGLYFREWKGVSRRTAALVWGGLAVLVASTVVIGIGNKLAGP